MQRLTRPGTIAPFGRWTRKPLRGSLAGAGGVEVVEKHLKHSIFLLK